MRKRGSWLRIAHCGQQAEHLHGLEYVLDVAAAAIVATKSQPDVRLPEIEYRCNTTFQFHVAQMIEHNPGICFGDPVHFRSADPDTVNDVELRPEHAIAFQVSNQRAVVIGELFTCDQDL